MAAESNESAIHSAEESVNPQRGMAVPNAWLPRHPGVKWRGRQR